MKKQMREENLMKISEKADRCINDTALAGILLCYVLYRVEEPMESEMLYDLAVTSGTISFFCYQEAIAALLDNRFIRTTQNEKHETFYSTTPSGVEKAKKLRNIAAKSYRDDLVREAKKAMLQRRHQKDVSIRYETFEHGCYLHVTLNDHAIQLLELRLFTPDEETARQLGDRILSSPSMLYHDVIQSVIRLPDISVDLTDN